MAFLEWRKFSFFDIHKNVDNGKVAKHLQDTHVTATTSGNGHVVLCDVTGWAHLISRSWEVTSFKAYELTVSLAQQLPHDPYLVTIGDDEAGVNPLIKVWDWSRNDRHGNPTCARISRAVPSHMRPTPATALAVHDNKSLLAVGFQDGSVSLFRGDIARQRSGKMRTLPDSGTSPITELAFKGADKLFVVSRACVMVIWLSTERCVTLDAMGAAPGCSVLADKHRLTVANNDALYCYTTEGRGPCYALEGEKVRLDWFRSYLVITTNDTPNKSAASTSTAPTHKSHHLTILDIQNKFIVFSKTFDEIDAVLTEWGSFYILTKNKEMIYLEEKDLQSKLSLLFKKNLYDVAIRIASSQHYDVAGLTEIYKQYGDHLYSKGDLKGAIEQYVKTIGWLETSYVIRKYLESRHLEPLVQYLEELHKKKGCATEDHTTLLLTCYVKIDQHDQQGKLKEFINSKDKIIDFDVDVAIKVMRQVSVDDALSLAANHKRHDWYLLMMIDDKKDLQKALDYIEELEFEDADMYMKKYGHRLIQHQAQETTRFLKLLGLDYTPRKSVVDEITLSDRFGEPVGSQRDDYKYTFLNESQRLIEFLEQMTHSDKDLSKLLCTDYKPCNKPLVDETSLSGGTREPVRALPDDYIHMFLNNSERLIEFLEHMTQNDKDCSKLVYDALIEHYIHVWAKSPATEKKEYEEKVLCVLKNPDANYDKDQTLIICQMLGFQAGVLYLYEENKLWQDQVALHLRSGDAESALAVCRRRGDLCPRLWLDVLWCPPPAHCLPELLNVIANEKLLSPILVIDCLASTPTYTLGDVRKYLTDVLKSENDVITREQQLSSKYRSESERMKEQTDALQNSPVVFQSSKCAVCLKPLELPTVHFLCQHSFHQYCFQTYCESEAECLVCATARRRTDSQPHAAEALHARLHNEHDPYAVVSEYYGRGLFNKLTVVTESGAVDPPASSGQTGLAGPGQVGAGPVGPGLAGAGLVVPGVASSAVPPAAAAPAHVPQSYGPGAEAKLRQQEGQSKQIFVANTAKQVAPKGTTVTPVPEGRMRLLEQQRYSSSLEANLNKLEPVHKPSPYSSPITAKRRFEDKPRSTGVSPVVHSISTAAINNGANLNPFDDDAYDETKNPFAEEAREPSNPFSEDDDYDKNYNPFS